MLFACALLLISQAYLGIIPLIAGALYGVGFGTFQSSTQADFVHGKNVSKRKMD